MAAPREIFALLEFLRQYFVESGQKELVIQRNRTLTMLSVYLCSPRDAVPKVDFFAEDIVPAMSAFDFKSHFRIERMTYEIILERIRPHLVFNHIGGKAPVTPEKQLLLFLWYMANQESMRELCVLFKVSISTVHAIITRVSKIIYRVLKTVIQWPDENRQVEIEREFQLQSGIPHIAGIIDGTHIQLSHVPNGDQDYVNRKSYPSVQLQLVVDHEMLITSAQTGWPGCTHDARVLRNSGIYDKANAGNLVNPERHII